MKVALATVVLGLSTVVSAACDGSQSLDLDSWKFEKVDNGFYSGLVMTMKDYRVSLSSIMDKGDKKMTPVATDSFPTDSQSPHFKHALMFSNLSSSDDFASEDWYPQGITSSFDAQEDGKWDGKQAWLVSWHNTGDKSVRVSVINQETNTYKDVVLVVPTAEDDFDPVPVHAGGIVWYGHSLWVADTWVGVRVFDLDNIWQVSNGTGFGKNEQGYTADGYEYVVPQKATYELDPSDFRFSFMSLNRGDDPDTLLFGEYQTQDLANTTRQIKFALDKQTETIGDETPVWGYCVGTARVQGAVHAGDTIYLSQSNSDDPGQYIAWQPGSANRDVFASTPRSPEDLTYNSRENVLYGLTEAVSGRYVLTYAK